MRSLVQRLKNLENEDYLVMLVAALAACVVTFSIVWLHTFGFIQ